jgi:transcriptional regulator with XRE-family HTH domain
MNYGERLKHFRETSGLSGRQLAIMVGLDPSAITKIEHDNTKPSLGSLEKICGALNITLVQFFDIGDNLKLLPPNLRDFVTKKENQGLLKLIKTMVDEGYSTEVIEEWIVALSKSLDSIKNKYNAPSQTTGRGIWIDEELLPKESRGKFTAEEIRIALELHRKRINDPGFIPPWKQK